MNLIFALITALPSVGMAATQLGEAQTFKSIDTELTVTKTSMYSSDVSIVFVGKKEAYNNCVSLYVWSRPSEPAESADLITCRSDDLVVSIVVKDNEAELLRSALDGHGIKYRGGSLNFLKRVQK